MTTTHGSLGPRWWISSTTWCLARPERCDVAAVGQSFLRGDCSKGCARDRKSLVFLENILLYHLWIVPPGHCFPTAALHILRVSDWNRSLFHGSWQVYKKEVKKEENLAVRHQGWLRFEDCQLGDWLIDFKYFFGFSIPATWKTQWFQDGFTITSRSFSRNRWFGHPMVDCWWSRCAQR